MTIVEALNDRRLFGAEFPAATWRPWSTFLRATYGLELDAEGLALYWQCTGRQDARTAQAREAWVIVGRRGGKSRIAALIAVYLACFRDYQAVLARGEIGTLPIVAADRRQARTVMGYVTGLLDGVPMLRRLVVKRTAESVELSTGCRIEIHTASWRALRGYTVVGAVLDEVSVWRSEDSANPDHEIVSALRPAMATVPNALLVAISSPYARRGVLWDAYRQHYGKDGDPVLVWKAGTSTMNPVVPPHTIATAYDEDPIAAAAEYCAEFRTDVEGLVSREVVEAATVPGRAGLPPVAATHYLAFTDPSGGAQDAFALAISHTEVRGDAIVAVLDYLTERRPPFSPDQVVGEYAKALKSYGVTTVQADKYAGAWVVEAFAKYGVHCEQSASPKSDIYRELVPLLHSGRAELLDDLRLKAQLLGLERRTARGGKDSIDHAPGAHDDLANAVAGSIVLAACLGAYSAPPMASGLAREPYQSPLGHEGLGASLTPINWNRVRRGGY